MDCSLDDYIAKKGIRIANKKTGGGVNGVKSRLGIAGAGGQKQNVLNRINTGGIMKNKQQGAMGNQKKNILMNQNNNNKMQLQGKPRFQSISFNSRIQQQDKPNFQPVTLRSLTNVNPGKNTFDARQKLQPKIQDARTKLLKNKVFDARTKLQQKSSNTKIADARLKLQQKAATAKPVGLTNQSMSKQLNPRKLGTKTIAGNVKPIPAQSQHLLNQQLINQHLNLGTSQPQQFMVGGQQFVGSNTQPNYGVNSQLNFAGQQQIGLTQQPSQIPYGGMMASDMMMMANTLQRNTAAGVPGGPAPAYRQNYPQTNTRPQPLQLQTKQAVKRPSYETPNSSDNAPPPNKITRTVAQPVARRQEEPVAANHVSPLEGYRVMVSNLLPSVSTEDVMELFGAVGALKRCKWLKDGRAEVVFVDQEAVGRAIKKYHRRELDGQPMNVVAADGLDLGDMGKGGVYDRLGGSADKKKKMETGGSGGLSGQIEIETNVLHRALFKTTATDASATTTTKAKPVSFTVHM